MAEGCPAGTIKVGEREEETATAVIVHPVCQAAAPAKTKPTDCAAAEKQAEQDRKAIETVRQTAEQGQEELGEWSKMNGDAQKDALWAAVEFAMASYAADTDQVAKSVSKLNSKADLLTKKLLTSPKYEARLKYLRELRAARKQLAPAKMVLASKEVVTAAADADQAWSIARKTMQNEFRVAAKHNDAMQQVLKDPGFRDAFVGDPDDAPGMEVVSALADQAVDEAVKAASTLAQYEKFTGPTVRAGVFVREEAYNALKSLLSTKRVLQQNDVAGQLAKATGVLQGQYKKSIDALRLCRAAKK